MYIFQTAGILISLEILSLVVIVIATGNAVITLDLI